MKKANILSFIIITASLFISCERYLDVAPSKSTSVVPSTTEELESLLNNYLVFKGEEDLNATLASDAFELSTELTQNFQNYPGYTNMLFALWDKEQIPNQTYNMHNGSSFFSLEYKKIFIANTVLNYLPRVSGNEEVKKMLEKEAKFIRAYSMWNLAQVYCLPYTDGNKSELGLTLKNSTSFEEPMYRSTLEETYKFIEENLNAALGMTNNMTKINGVFNSVRANKAAVNGFAARYWLNRNDYEKALQYSNLALESHSNLVNYNTRLGHYQGIPALPSTFSGFNRFEWDESVYMRDNTFSYWYNWITPSKKLLDLYNQSYDLRYEYHIVKNYAKDYWGLTSVSIPAYVFFYNSIPSGPSTAEMLLIKAESLARLGKVSEALLEVNKLRDVRMLASAPASAKYLNATSKQEAIKVILDERMREMPFTQRWNDIRRLNNNEDLTDDVGDLSRTYFEYNETMILKTNPSKTYTLQKNSRRYAVPIPQSDIEASGRVIKQNTY